MEYLHLVQGENAPTLRQRRIILWLAHGLLLCTLLFLVTAGLVLGRPYSQSWHLVIAHLVGGRPLNAGVGVQLGYNPWFVFLQSTAQDFVTMLYIYPLLLLGYRHATRLPVIGQRLEAMHHRAYEKKEKLAPYGVVGLFTFVFVPFWGTGPIMGLLVGYLIGLSVSTTFLTAAAAVVTSTAAWIWGYHTLHEYDETLALYLFLGAILLAACIGAAMKLRHWRQSRSVKGEV